MLNIQSLTLLQVLGSHYVCFTLFNYYKQAMSGAIYLFLNGGNLWWIIPFQSNPLNHIQRKPRWQLLITVLHWIALKRRCNLLKDVLFLQLILWIRLYKCIKRVTNSRILLITVFIVCICWRASSFKLQ